MTEWQNQGIAISQSPSLFLLSASTITEQHVVATPRSLVFRLICAVHILRKTTKRWSKSVACGPVTKMRNLVSQSSPKAVCVLSFEPDLVSDLAEASKTCRNRRLTTSVGAAVWLWVVCSLSPFTGKSIRCVHRSLHQPGSRGTDIPTGRFWMPNGPQKSGYSKNRVRIA